MYTHLVAGSNQQDREEFDKNLYAPPVGWAEVQRRIFTIVAEGD